MCHRFTDGGSLDGPGRFGTFQDNTPLEAAAPPSSEARAPAGPVADGGFTGYGPAILGLPPILRSLAGFGPDPLDGQSPEAAVLNLAGNLAVGAAEKRPVVRNSEIVPRTIMSVTLSADHRVVDGATAADFLRTLKQMLEEPGHILLPGPHEQTIPAFQKFRESFQVAQIRFTCQRTQPLLHAQVGLILLQ